MVTTILSDYVPDTGDIIELDLTSQIGIESSGLNKKALVLSKKYFNKLIGFAVLCPVENTSFNPTYEIEINLLENNINKEFILFNQIKSLDWKKRNAKFQCRLPDEIVNVVKDKVGHLM